MKTKTKRKLEEASGWMMWIVMGAVLTILPGSWMMWMTATRVVSKTYLIPNAEGYTIAGLFILVGVVLIGTTTYTMIDRLKEIED